MGLVGVQSQAKIERMLLNSRDDVRAQLERVSASNLESLSAFAGRPMELESNLLVNSGQKIAKHMFSRHLRWR